MTRPLALIFFFLCSPLTTFSQDLPPEITRLIQSANQGDWRSQIQLGMRYRDGRGVEQNNEEALAWYRKCADQGIADGLDNVGYMYLKGWGVPVNFDIATGYFKASAAKNHAQGQFNLGNSYFSGQGVEQDYSRAIEQWQRASEQGHLDASWRLATLYASGEGLPQDRRKAIELCLHNARKKHPNSALLLGELLALEGDAEGARTWWKEASRLGNRQADFLMELADWRWKEATPGSRAFIEVDHLYQGWNNCGATSIAMFSRYSGATLTPYAIKRLCPRNPIGTGTDWADLLEVRNGLDQRWELVTFDHDDRGFDRGTHFIRQHLDQGNPVVIDFTVARERNGRTEHFGHTLLVVGYHADRDQYIVKNPNQPPPGIQVMSANELKESWHSRGYSRLARGKSARPLIVKAGLELPGPILQNPEDGGNQ